MVAACQVIPNVTQLIHVFPRQRSARRNMRLPRRASCRRFARLVILLAFLWLVKLKLSDEASAMCVRISKPPSLPRRLGLPRAFSGAAAAGASDAGGRPADTG